MSDTPSFGDALDISRNLWMQSFPDEGDYTDFYFSRRCTQNVMLCLHSAEGVFDSAFQLFPYEMNLKGISTHVLYMSGVCTRPDMRGKGYMEHCMRENLARQTDAALVTLIPANEKLFAYYERFGFHTISKREMKEYTDYNMHTSYMDMLIEDIPAVSASAEQRHRIYTMFHRHWKNMSDAIIHTEEDFQSVLDAYIPDQLHLLSGCLSANKDTAIAAALYSERSSEIIVHDFMDSGHNGSENALLLYLYHKKQSLQSGVSKENKPLRYFSYTNKPFMMARVLNASRAIELYFKTNKYKNTGIHLIDDFLRDNTGYYSIQSGEISKDDSPMEDIQYACMTQEELIASLFHETELHASLMLDY
ncbi:MAG: GNAT family N-acetyltransferase [Bacteroides sp.]|nr:GNAT family N-acetyltransferase [Roseburia sp.]MCM1347117.1 GNAT family N-acetyltransferase [Bacteroides sp.]MCM1421661.1 GNAT family N-acetyltransferase [Bacteroides sp.]